MSDREQELEALAQDYAAKQELARLAGEEDYLITEQYETNLAALKEKFRQEDLDAAQKLADEQKKIDEAKAQQKAQIEQASFTLAKLLRSVKKIVIFTTSSRLYPAASHMLLRLLST